jgi:tetratricopeptide (TPR) repeat protein
MGNSFYQLRRYTAAIEAYNKALLLQPDYGEALQALNITIWVYDTLKAQGKPVQQYE